MSPTTHGCGAAKLLFALNWIALGEQVRHVDELLCDLAEPLAAVHRHAPQRLKRFVLVHAAGLHKDSLGALDELALLELLVRIGELLAQPLIFVESRHRDFDDGLYACGVEAVDD